MAERHNYPPGLLVRPDQPLIGVMGHEGDHEVVRYYADDKNADSQAKSAGIQRAQSGGGVE